MGGTVKDVSSRDELVNLIQEGKPVILHFWASWCDASKQMDQVFTHLAVDHPHARFLRVEAEEQPEISEDYSVSAVPYFVFCKDGKSVDTLEGANPASLANKVAKLAGPCDPSGAAAPASLGMSAGPSVLEAVKEMAKGNDSTQVGRPEPFGLSEAVRSRLQQLINSYPVFLFMKGSPEMPKCRFSQKVVSILKAEGIEFGTFDILTDDEIREGMKKLSNWPTFPQLYCKGELIGGCDIVTAMHESGELKEIFRDHGVLSEASGLCSSSGVAGTTVSSGLSDSLTLRLKELVNSYPVMLFIEGTPEKPKCGFGRQIIEILQQEKVDFKSFDILSDDEVGQGLKVFSNWSSYPQLYMKGQLIGGADVVLEMQGTGMLRKLLREKGFYGGESLEERLKNLISSSPTVLFLKGTPDAPQCGFSSKVVHALRKVGIKFRSFDILQDDQVRQGLKIYSNWPTFPQLYHNGELIGGYDIVMELLNSGELKSTLSD